MNKMDNIKQMIEAAWENRALIKESSTQEAIREVINLL